MIIGLNETVDMISRYPLPFNPIPAGVYENQDALGGGSIRPFPPQNRMFDVQMMHHWKSLIYSTFLICKKMIFFCKIQLNRKNVCKKNVQKMIKYFEKPLTMPFQICRHFSNISNKLICN